MLHTTHVQYMYSNASGLLAVQGVRVPNQRWLTSRDDDDLFKGRY